MSAAAVANILGKRRKSLSRGAGGFDGAALGSSPRSTVPLCRMASPAEERRKFYFDGGQVEVAAHLVYEVDTNGKQLRVVRYIDYAAEAVRTLCPTAPALREQWADPTRRSEIIQGLAERGVSFDELADVAQQPDADPFDLLCHLAFNAPLRTRRERAQQLKADQP